MAEAVLFTENVGHFILLARRQAGLPTYTASYSSSCLYCPLGAYSNVPRLNLKIEPAI